MKKPPLIKLNHEYDFDYPRLMVNTGGEIVLVASKVGLLSRGVLVAKTPDAKSNLPVGTALSDWEVCFGDLVPYNGPPIPVVLKSSKRR